MKIGIFDSGRGGKSVEAEIKKTLPDAEIIYLADTKHLPYGSKSDAELRNICEINTATLLEKGAQVVVVACNTATTVAIRYLRERFPGIPIVGTEPAIKKACEVSSKTARILLLATEATVKSERTRELVRNYKREGQKVFLRACPGLADAIEAEDEERIFRLLTQVRAGTDKAETIVLGCTHYPLIRNKIQEVFPEARLVDGGEGVAREVARLVINIV